jgi:signal transduction histidine kinase
LENWVVEGGPVAAMITFMDRKWTRLAATCAALVFAVVLLVVSWSPLPALLPYLPLRLFGVVAIGVGFLAWHSRTWSRTGPLIVAVGVTYHLQNLQVSTNPTVFAVGFCLAYLWPAVIGHLVLTWPTGRADGRPLRLLVLTCYLAATGTQILRYVVDHPAPPLAPMSPYEHTPAAKLGSITLLAVTLLVVAAVARRWTTASRLRRGTAAPVWAAVMIAGVLGTSAAVASLLELPVATEYALLLGSLTTSVFVLLPVIVLARTARMARLRWRLTSLVLDSDPDLDLQTEPDLLQRKLIDVLGDATLRMAYPLDDGYIDVWGRPFHPRPDRGHTTVTRHGRTIALLEHDEVLRAEHAIAATTEAVVAVSIEGARRYAVMRAQVEQIRVSRLRLATVAFEERHRIQRDLHDGAQQHLLAVLVLLDLARRTPDEARVPALVRRAHSQLADAITSLRHLTQGIYPAVLAEHGLAAAVEGLADLAPIPVSFTVPQARWPRHLEATAYFTITEALANTYKHAGADHVQIDVRTDDHTLRVEIADNGCGGVETGSTGLRGLRDRIATVDGTLHVHSRSGEGTCVVATIPLETP